ncbi:MAG: RDD family protein [Cyclobacteriaceae bacterium]|nr:RDD family protein [Cyclobacteriaceae bacterium]
MAIYINTSQNVQINYKISSIGDRLVAYLIDTLVIIGIVLGFVLISDWIGTQLVLFLAMVVVFFYHLISEITMNGQSIGKRNRGIRVMKKDGNAATFSAYFLRFLLRPIDSFYGLGLAIIFLTNNNQRIGDLAAGTVVVDVVTEDELLDQISGQKVSKTNEEIMYSGVTQLTDSEIQFIRKVLHKRAKEKYHVNVHELARKVAEKIDVNLDGAVSYYFLERVVQDYYNTYSE